MSWDTIVVGYDDTDDARRAVGRAVALARGGKARLILASVAAALPSGAAAHGIGPYDPADAPDERQSALERLRCAIEAEGVEAGLEVELGEPADALVGLAKRENADLIVVGTREPGFLDRLLHGSVSQGVARHSVCDVLIVH
jgi:nucleotide-binding universal stress UspA family protein